MIRLAPETDYIGGDLWLTLFSILSLCLTSNKWMDWLAQDKIVVYHRSSRDWQRQQLKPTLETKNRRRVGLLMIEANVAQQLDSLSRAGLTLPQTHEL
jgi:hypothetical protein